MNQLTNQKLITELEKRVQEGTIKMKVDNQIEPNSLTARLFNLSVNQGKQENESTNSSGLFNTNTLLWVGLIALTFLVVCQKSYKIRNEVKFFEAKE